MDNNFRRKASTFKTYIFNWPPLEIMNKRQLQKLGVPEECVREAIRAIGLLTRDGSTRNNKVKRRLQETLESPETFLDDEHVGSFATALIADRHFVRPKPVAYRTWGDAGIDREAHRQMEGACSVPVAQSAALMPDAHVGYGLPIGGVLACKNAVIPYAVGVDIACRMKLSVLELPTGSLESKFQLYRDSR